MLSFIESWTINLQKLPSYDGFKEPIHLKINKPFCDLLMSGVNTKITNEMITNFKNNVYDKIDKNDNLTITHNNRLGMGRFYSDDNKSICCHSKFIKHSIFVLENWLDVDMVKGHPSILRYLCILNNIDYSILDKIVYYFDDVCNKIKKHYNDCCGVVLTDDNIKYFFNLTIYGGGYSTWINKLADVDDADKYGYEIKIIPDMTPIHPLMSEFQMKCQEIIKLVYDNNPDIIRKLKNDGITEYKMKSKTMSYFCGIIENHIVYFVRNYLNNNGGIINNVYLPEYDGLCMPRIVGCNYDLLIKSINKHLDIYGIRFKIKPYGDFVLHDVIDIYRKKYIVDGVIVDGITDGVVDGVIDDVDMVDVVDVVDGIVEDITDDEDITEEDDELTNAKITHKDEIKPIEIVNCDDNMETNNKTRLQVLNDDIEALNIRLIATLKDDKITLKTTIAEKRLEIKKLEKQAKEDDKKAKVKKAEDEKKAREKKAEENKKAKEKKAEEDKKAQEKKKADEREAELKNKRIVEDDEETAVLVIEDLKNRVETFDGTIYLKNGNIWISDFDKVKKQILDYILKSNFVKKFGDRITPYAQNIRTANDICNTVILKLQLRQSGKDLYKKFHSSTIGTLAFLDGILNFKNKTFIKWEDVDFEYYTTQQINYNFGEYFKKPDKNIIDKVKKEIYDNLYGKDVKKALNFLSRAIAGHSEDKNFATYVGNRDSGKGVQYANLFNTFENYVKTFELENILYERDTNADETSRKMYWLLDYEFVRIGISQETPDAKSKKKVSGKLLKKLAGGGDTQVARRNYDRKDTYFNIDTTFMFYGNNSLKYDTKDVLEHCVSFTSASCFKTEEEINKMKQDGKSQLEWGIYKVKNPEIKDNCSTMEWKLATVYLLYENYVKDAITIKIEKDDDDNNETLRSLIFKSYEITREYKKDYILVSEVVNHLLDDSKKITIELESMGVIKKKSNIKDDTKDKMCYYGLVKRTVEETNDVDVDVDEDVDNTEPNNILIEIEEENEEEDEFIDVDSGKQ
jgi:regulator of protease activity HflC (stomatin/prohibitin superfamily)